MQDPASGHPPPTDRDDRFDEPAGRWGFRFSPATFLIGFGIGAFAGVALAILAYSITDNKTTEPATVSAAPQLDDPGPAVSRTPQATAQALPKSTSAQDVRLGPGSGYAVVGSLAKGESVEVIGRDNGSQWLAIRFPPGSAGQGWIPVTGVDSSPDLARLNIALPTPLPRTVSTFPAGQSLTTGEDNAADSSGASTGTPNAVSGTPTPVPGPVDLVVTRVGLVPDRHVSVTVSNRGPGDLVGFTIFVQVRDLGARSEVVSAPVPMLRVGQTITLQTSSFQITGEETIQAIVDPFGSVPEVDKTNNTVQVVLAAPVTPTPTPSPFSDLP